MLFNSECIYKNYMEHISMPFNLKIILAFCVHKHNCKCSIQNFEYEMQFFNPIASN